jgi:hypothetical protein
VEDFLVDEQDWAIRYAIVDPRSWWPGYWDRRPEAWRSYPTAA